MNWRIISCRKTAPDLTSPNRSTRQALRVSITDFQKKGDAKRRLSTELSGISIYHVVPLVPLVPLVPVEPVPDDPPQPVGSVGLQVEMVPA
jgi:hypothetical protein